MCLLSAAVITASASVLVAVLVFLLNQRAQVRQELRLARLERVNSQLRELYGPLNALVDVNERIWESLRQSHLPPQANRKPGSDESYWRKWRDNALMPTNRKIRDLIIEHADLLVETDVPVPLRDFCAHVTALELVIAAEADNNEESILISHPGAAFVTYVRDAFSQLKSEQQRLLQMEDRRFYLTS